MEHRQAAVGVRVGDQLVHLRVGVVTRVGPRTGSEQWLAGRLEARSVIGPAAVGEHLDVALRPHRRTRSTLADDRVEGLADQVDVDAGLRGIGLDGLPGRRGRGHARRVDDVNFSCWPFLMPVPHFAGSWQVMTPPDSDQPWLVSRDLALEMLNGYGPCPALVIWMGGAYGFVTVVGAGPEVGVAYPRQIALLIPGWSRRTAAPAGCRAAGP